MLCRQHGYPWPSLATSLYRSSPLAGLQGYILHLHIAAVSMFELVVLLLLGHMWGSINYCNDINDFNDNENGSIQNLKKYFILSIIGASLKRLFLIWSN